MSQSLAVRGSLKATKNGSLAAEFVRSSGCHRCASAAGCGTRVLAPNSSRVTMPWAGNSHGDQAGHPIEAEIPAASLIMLALLCYLVPAFMVVAGAWAATVIFPETGDAAAVAGLVAGLFLTRWIIRAADLDSWARACVRIRAVQGRNS